MLPMFCWMGLPNINTFSFALIPYVCARAGVFRISPKFGAFQTLEKAYISGKILFSGRALTLQEGHYGGVEGKGARRRLFVMCVCARTSVFRISLNFFALEYLKVVKNRILG